MNLDTALHATTSGSNFRGAVESILSTHLSELVDEIVQARSRHAGTTATAPPGPAATGVEYLHGRQTINEAIADTVSLSGHEILTAQPDGPRPEAVLGAALETVRAHLAAGVRMRTLYQHSTRFDEPTKKYARSVIELGGQLRTLDEFFERLIIVDGGTAFIPAAHDRAVALKVTDPWLVRFLHDLFDRTWDRAAPFPYQPNRAREAAPEVMPEIRQAIQRLLVGGHTDKSIARRMGISERTVTGHVAWLREYYGATNRLQLGYRLAEEDLRAEAAGSPRSRLDGAP
jgi:hypothetical protein